MEKQILTADDILGITQGVLDGYYCVFVGDPVECAPIALFSNFKHAVDYAAPVVDKRILKYKYWKRLYKPKAI